ncbi:MAG: PfkB family carbohydrate kinase [Candidatus Limnocylindrales bacterium]
MSRQALDVVHVGSAARDVAPDDPRGWRLGGGVTYAALTTARLGLRTGAVVGVDRPAAEATELEALRAAGVQLHLVPLAESPVFHNAETATGRVQIVVAPGVPLDPQALPASWLAAAGWSLVPVADEVGEAWIEAIPAGATVAVGWQGMLRTLVAGQRVVRRPPVSNALLRRADLVGVSHHDVDPATRLSDLVALISPGARLLVTQGERGGLLVRRGGRDPIEVLRFLPTRTDREVDPTGAGDTFLAALLASAVQPSVAGPGARRADGPDLRFAAAAGSLAVEGIGLAGVPDLVAVRRRRVREHVGRALRPAVDARVGIVGHTGDAVDPLDPVDPIHPA